MPLHALAVSKSAPKSASLPDYAFDPALADQEKALLSLLLGDLIRLGWIPRLTSCCCFTAELVAGLLCRKGIAAEAVPCRVVIRTPEGVAILGEGFARPGQIDSHFATMTETMLVDWALGAARTVARLRPLPLGITARRSAAMAHLAESQIGETHRVTWEPVTPGPGVVRHHMAEKLKAARVLRQASLIRGRLR